MNKNVELNLGALYRDTSLTKTKNFITACLIHILFEIQNLYKEDII